ncbi:branched-chain amino acid ABC transporter permease [Nocardioides dongxiaopingii]|uniref:ABC transporter permease subunit n=1 Tax=Nocardioides TaxID=1839 RepID=UPI0010C76FD7|nr:MULTISPECIES: branched-chain amino acid ABC transporter permease [Nocardioides]QCW50462.2 branched-chain amino acid ABC transporter permease [Nocardioides sp. S-1144]
MPNRQTPSRGVLARPLAAVVALGAFLALFVLAGPASPASAACDGTAIPKTMSGVLVNSADDGAPVPGVAITVTNCDGVEFEGETDESGAFTIDFEAGIGPVTVALDPETLPDGVEMRDGASTTNTLTGSLTELNTTFLIGPDGRNVETKWDRVAGLVYSGLLFGLILAMAALGLSMVFGTTGLTNFAHGELVTFGAMAAFFVSTGIPLPFTDNDISLPFIWAVPAVVVLALGFGWLQNTVLWQPLRKRGVGLIAAMIVSIGLQFFLRNVYAYLTGSRTETYQDYYTPEGKDAFGLFTYTNRDIAIAITCIVVLTVVLLVLQFTRIGRATRAVSDNPALAAATGINVDRVISLVWIVGTALAALSGVFLGFTLGVTYQIGQLVLLLLFAACCVGGLGSVWGALLGALIIGVLIDLSTLVIPSDLKNAGALLLLIVILLVRPQGLLGRRERVG